MTQPFYENDLCGFKCVRDGRFDYEARDRFRRYSVKVHLQVSVHVGEKELCSNHRVVEIDCNTFKTIVFTPYLWSLIEEKYNEMTREMLEGIMFRRMSYE